ncbi:signal peptide peptidase SppA [bacterium LRH843]|nr:signal peptide peptidase SppA [bacterium LRH843]
MSRKRWLALIAFAMLLVASLSVNMATLSKSVNTNSLLGSAGSEWDEKTIKNGKDIGGSIAVIEINGVIEDTGEGSLFQTSGYRHQLILSQLEHAAENPTVKGIVVRVNTPGGGVVESAEIYEKIIYAQEKYKKPVFVSMGSMAASGGYYISAPADKIVASPQTITGSLGVIMESINVSRLAEKYGVKVNTIKSGPYKDIMSSTREMTEDERAILQSLINESYEEFVEIIAKGRHISEEDVRKIADGRIYSGKQALELNLIDELGSLDDTIALMKKHIGADYPVVKYETSVGISKLFSMSMEIATGKSDLAGLERLLSKDRSPTLKYLYTD